MNTTTSLVVDENHEKVSKKFTIEWNLELDEHCSIRDWKEWRRKKKNQIAHQNYQPINWCSISVRFIVFKFDNTINCRTFWAKRKWTNLNSWCKVDINRTDKKRNRARRKNIPNLRSSHTCIRRSRCTPVAWPQYPSDKNIRRIQRFSLSYIFGSLLLFCFHILQFWHTCEGHAAMATNKSRDKFPPKKKRNETHWKLYFVKVPHILLIVRTARRPSNRVASINIMHFPTPVCALWFWCRTRRTVFHAFAHKLHNASAGHFSVVFILAIIFFYHFSHRKNKLFIHTAREKNVESIWLLRSYSCREPKHDAGIVFEAIHLFTFEKRRSPLCRRRMNEIESYADNVMKLSEFLSDLHCMRLLWPRITIFVWSSQRCGNDCRRTNAHFFHSNFQFVIRTHSLTHELHADEKISRTIVVKDGFLPISLICQQIDVEILVTYVSNELNWWLHFLSRCNWKRRRSMRKTFGLVEEKNSQRTWGLVRNNRSRNPSQNWGMRRNCFF